MEQASSEKVIELVADIVSAFVSKNSVQVNEVPTLITNVRGALAGLGAAQQPAAARPEAPMPWKKAIKPDFIVSYEDGRHYKSMKRHLGRYGLTPESYREKWGLPRDFAMVSPNYAAARSAMAKRIGLGQKGPAARKVRKGSKKSAD
jgi:predicted transcriptional regulator